MEFSTLDKMVEELEQEKRFWNQKSIKLRLLLKR